MANRSAHYSLLGYHYQFDKSILELLNLPNEGTVTVEGIEDIDISTPEPIGIQCKYLHAQRFARSLLRHPLQAMLLDDKGCTTPKHYILYAHFNDRPCFTPLTIKDLKDIITYKENRKPHCFHVDHDLNDETLERFLQRFDLQFGPSFDEQHQILLTRLATTFECSKDVVENFYYPRALTSIVATATRPRRDDRTIAKGPFLTQVGERTTLFSHWLRALLGKERSIAYHKTVLKRTSALRPQNWKLLVLTSATIFRDQTYTLLALLQALIDKSYRVEHALHDAAPWTIAAELDEAALNDLKRSLLQKDIAYNDGHEDLGFFPAHFKTPPVVNRSTTGRGLPTDKIGRTSYSLRLISTATLTTHATAITPDVLITTNGPILGLTAQHTIALGAEYTLQELAFILT